MLIKKASCNRQIVLHIGGPKTGTGSIQRAFNPQKPQVSLDLLDKLGFQFLYSKNNISSNLGPLVNNLSSENLTTFEKKEWAQSFDLQFDQLKKSQSKSFVFSAERLGDPRINRVSCGRTSEFINSIGNVIEVIYYSRSIMSIALSLGLQHAKSGKSKGIRGMTSIKPTHVVDKYRMYSSEYTSAKMGFYNFERNSLRGGDVRLDIAYRLARYENYLPQLEAELVALPNANEKIDRSMLSILRSLYHKNGIDDIKKVPPIFVNFITMGKWTGSPCIHSDLYTAEEIKILYQLQNQEISILREFGADSNLGKISKAFEKTLKPIDYYMDAEPSKVEIDTYCAEITNAQLTCIRILLSKMRKLSLRNSQEFKALLSFESDPMSKTFLVTEMLTYVLSASLLVS